MDTTNHPCTKAQTVLHRQNEPVHYHTGRNIRMRNGWRVPPCSYPAVPGKKPPAGPPCSYPAMPGKETPPAATGTGLFRTGSTAFRL